jgi:hypothetical protein
MQNKLRVVAVVVAALVLAVGTWIAFDKYSRRTHAVKMVRDAASRLQTVLQAQTGGDGSKVDLETHATALEGYSTTLKRMNTASFTPLADAADDYLVTAREIARRAVEMQRARTALAASLAALSAHIQSDRGAASWPAEASRLKQAVDKDLRDDRIAVESYRTLLASLPASQAKVAPYVEGMPLVEDALVEQAGAQALDAYRAAEQNVKQVADLGAYARRR